MKATVFAAAILAAVAEAKPARKQPPVPYYSVYPPVYTSSAVPTTSIPGIYPYHSKHTPLGSVTTSATYTTSIPPYPTTYPGHNTTTTSVYVPPPPSTYSSHVPSYTYSAPSHTYTAPIYTYSPPAPTTVTVTETTTAYAGPTGCSPGVGPYGTTSTYTTTITWTDVVPSPPATYSTTLTWTVVVPSTYSVPTTSPTVTPTPPTYTTMPTTYPTIVPTGGPGGNGTTPGIYPYVPAPPAGSPTTYVVRRHAAVPVPEADKLGPGALHYTGAATSLNVQSGFAALVALIVVAFAL